MQKKDYIIQLLKYIIMAIVVGIIVGTIDALFGRVLIAISEFRTIHYQYLLPFLPIAGLVITAMYYVFSKLSLKGMKLIFEVGQQKTDAIPLLLIPLVMIGTWLTHLFGGSAGREGVAVQIGATLSHALGRKLNFPENGRIMLVIGMAAGFGGLFQTPLSATFFAIEVIVIGKMDYEALLPALASAYIAAFTSHSLGLEKFSVAIKNTINLTGTKTIISVIILGILFGLTGRLFSFSLSKLKVFMGETIMNQYLRIGVMAIPLAALLFIIHGSRYSGLGTNIISAGFAGQTIYSYDWLLKLLFTIFTLAIGFQGGEVTPLFSIGTSLGVILGGLLGLPPMLCAALGYAAVFGSATNTLIAPIMIGLEVFGGADMVLFVIVCVIAYGMLILDEATSSIDTRTELKVQAAFQNIMEGRTSFIVAHRLSTIQNATTILVMEQGKIIEQGNHQTLLSRNGFYAKLYHSQFANA